MMNKDFELEQAFDEYIEGSTPPSARVTEAAKNSINNKKTLSTVIKGALIAIAGVVSTCGTAIAMYFTPAAIGGLIDAGSGGNFSGDIGPSGTGSGFVQEIQYYDHANLTESALNIYSHDAPEGLDFIKNIYLASNCSVDSLTVYSGAGNFGGGGSGGDNSVGDSLDGDKIAYVKAEITASVNSCRQETVIYAEYAGENNACELFREYYDGTTAYYRGHTFLYLDSEDNGEYVKKMLIENNGVTYYVCVTSSDVYAYRTWLDLIIK